MYPPGGDEFPLDNELAFLLTEFSASREQFSSPCKNKWTGDYQQ